MSKYGIDEETKVTLGVGAALVVLFMGAVLICWGPAGFKTSISGWQASAYGSDWLVVQYAQSGCIISHWELEDEAVQNEGSSDGIFFVTEGGPVVHLSGHYTYVQSPSNAIREQLWAKGPCAEAE